MPTGIKLNEFKKQSNINFRKKYKIAKDDKVLIFVGRLGKEKNVDFLINSLALINKKNEKVKLGKKQYRKEIDKYFRDHYEMDDE